MKIEAKFYDAIFLDSIIFFFIENNKTRITHQINKIPYNLNRYKTHFTLFLNLIIVFKQI